MRRLLSDARIRLGACVLAMAAAAGLGIVTQAGASADIQVTPCSVSRSRLKTGLTTPIGWIAAQTSWR